MSTLSPILRLAAGNHLVFWCPGCDEAHGIAFGEGDGPRWGWNGNAEKPTFTPSVLVRGRSFTAQGQADYDAWYEAGCPRPAPQFEAMDTVCHSFIVDGQIQFLGDCTHALVGQTVPIPAWPTSDGDGEPRILYLLLIEKSTPSR